MTLRVKGRDVLIPAFWNGAARARFHDLCGQMLGPADYLALAEVARVLVLEDIPRLGRNNFNEAKRFVTLIDALYEARVHLICSAADVPERLYVEGEGAFEFERTASRLREMQGADWGRPRLGPMAPGLLLPSNSSFKKKITKNPKKKKKKKKIKITSR